VKNDNILSNDNFSHKCELLQEAASYFRGQTGFNRLFRLFIDKYQSLGRIGGSVQINKLTDAERDALAGIMRRDYSQQRSATIHLDKFNHALSNTRFSRIDLKDLLDAYAGETIQSREDQEREYAVKKAAFFEKLRQSTSHLRSESWLNNILSKGPGTRSAHLAYDRQPERLKTWLLNIFHALENLPDTGGNVNYRRLPVFAADITGDPHGLDVDTEQGKIFISALKYLRSMEDDGLSYQPSVLSAEQLNELLEFYGLVRDDILNFVTVIGLKGLLYDGKKIWQDAYEQGMVKNIPLKELTRLSSITTPFAGDGRLAVYVVENSGVFSELVDRLKDAADTHGWPYRPLICTHGQFKLATWFLLDMLVKLDTEIYYSGDFDPEGLLMAQRLIERYPDHARLLHYDEAAYMKSLSRVRLPQHRLKKLQNVTLSNLQVVKEMMLDKEMAGYQETLIDEMIMTMLKCRGKIK